MTAANPAAGQQTLPLTVGGDTDILTLATAASGSGQLTVAAPGGTVLLTVAHAGQALVAEFGPAHAPLLLVRGDATACGSAGCSYRAYTFRLGANQAVAVPAPSVAALRFDRKRGTLMAAAVPTPGGLFGFITPNADGIDLSQRLYDLFQHVQSQEYVYAADGTAAGEWLASGTPFYSPNVREDVPFTSAATTVLGLVQARSLNLPAEGLPLIAASTRAAVWGSLAPLAAWGPSLMEDDAEGPSVSQTGIGSVVREELSGTVGTGAGQTLQVLRLTAVVTAGPVPGTFLVQRVSVVRVAVPVNTARGALQAARRAVRRRQIPGSLPAGALMVFPAGLSWQITEVGPLVNAPWVSVSAVSGRVTATGS